MDTFGSFMFCFVTTTNPVPIFFVVDLPLSAFTDSLSSFDSARDIVVHCKMGGRSAKAVRQLQAAGFKKVWNLAGGILRWSDDVDPSVPKY